MESLWPEYITDLRILSCPSNPQADDLMRPGCVDEQGHSSNWVYDEQSEDWFGVNLGITQDDDRYGLIDLVKLQKWGDASYMYFGWSVTDNALVSSHLPSPNQGLYFLGMYTLKYVQATIPGDQALGYPTTPECPPSGGPGAQKLMEQDLRFSSDDFDQVNDWATAKLGAPPDSYPLPSPGEHPVLDVSRLALLRLREGVERFTITDINNPVVSVVALSSLGVVWDVVSPISLDFNHLPGGANVLFMDGHVEFYRYPSVRFPVTKECASIARFLAEWDC